MKAGTLGAWAVGAALAAAGCSSENGKWVILPVLTPPVATTAGDPMAKAEAVARTVPNSLVLIGHGDAYLPLYPAGTVVVVQKIQWDHVQPGMTAVYYVDPGLSAAAVSAGLVTRREDPGWHILSRDPMAPRPRLILENQFIGVVVAAYVARDRYEPAALLREAPPEVANTCLLRCHPAPPP